MIRSIIAYFTILGLAVSCAPGTISSSSSGTEKYMEDISGLRPKQSVREDSTETQQLDSKEYSNIIPRYDVTADLNTILDSIDASRGNVRYVDGFTIQVYSGPNSEEAKLARGKVYVVIPDSRPALKYDEPNFKVKVGKFYTRLDAQKTFTQLKSKFPSAIIIPERIYFR